MQEASLEKVKAVVILDKNYREYDKLFTLFTKDYGKIRAYAFNVRREHSKKIGLLRLFSFCEVDLKTKGDNYNLDDASIIDGFDKLSDDYENMCYASYFVELVDYFSFENIESSEIFRLLYYTFKALTSGAIDRTLIKTVFELKMLRYEGEYIESSDLKTKNETLRYTWDYVLKSEPKDLYKFKLTGEVHKLFRDAVNFEFKSKVNKKFKSLENL